MSSPAYTETPQASAAELFTRLEEHMAEYADLHSALALLNWDQETYMPRGGAEGRGRQLRTLSGLAHRHFTDASVGRLLDALESRRDELQPLQQRAVAVLRRDYEREIRVPESLVRELAEAQSVGMEAWKVAREKSDFPIFRPHLEKLLGLKRRLADIWGYAESPYDALHDAHERGSTAAKLRPVFERLREGLVPLLGRIREAGRTPRRDFLRRRYDLTRQWDFTLEVLRDVGFNFDEGRQDRSVHPFSTGIGEGDVRITTRLREDDLTVILGSTIHEAGHALYDQAMDRKAVGVILAEATSLGIHESQSRLWENLVGLSQPFLEHYLPRLRELFPEQLADVTARELYEAVNVVEPSLIRVEADEVTYNLHVLVRFELELALVEGTLAVADLPGAWNDRYEAYLGVRPANDAEGCLQDIHWSMGAVGYFPTYTLGNLYSVPFFEAARKDVPGLGTHITPAIMQQLREWLRQQVHRTGRSETAEEISVRITGEPLTPEPFLAYLNAKYSDLYRLG